MTLQILIVRFVYDLIVRFVVPNNLPALNKWFVVPKNLPALNKNKNKKNHSTQDSRVVPHRGTNWAALWLTAQIRRDAVLSESYGRGYLRDAKPHIYVVHSYMTIPNNNEQLAWFHLFIRIEMAIELQTSKGRSLFY
jgi:hypothetical protein